MTKALPRGARSSPPADEDADETGRAEEEQPHRDRARRRAGLEEKRADVGVKGEVADEGDGVGGDDRREIPAAAAGGAGLFGGHGDVGQDLREQGQDDEEHDEEGPERRAPPDRVAERGGQRHAGDEPDGHPRGDERERAPGLVGRHESGAIADRDGEEEGVRRAADGAPDREDGESGRECADEVAQGVAADRHHEQALAGHALGPGDKGDGEHGDHRGVDADEEPDLGLAATEAARHVRQETDRHHLGRDPGEDRGCEAEEAEAGARVRRRAGVCPGGVVHFLPFGRCARVCRG